MLCSMPHREEWNDRKLLSTAKSWKYLWAMALQFNFMSRATKGYNPASSFHTHTVRVSEYSQSNDIVFSLFSTLLGVPVWRLLPHGGSHLRGWGWRACLGNWWDGSAGRVLVAYWETLGENSWRWKTAEMIIKPQLLQERGDFSTWGEEAG